MHKAYKLRIYPNHTQTWGYTGFKGTYAVQRLSVLIYT